MKPPVTGYVYFLANEKNEVVYVGQSTSLENRVRSHRAEKAFSSVYFVKVNLADINAIEEIFIAIFNPKLNNSQPRPFSVSRDDIEFVRAWFLDNDSDLVDPMPPHGISPARRLCMPALTREEV